MPASDVTSSSAGETGRVEAAVLAVLAGNAQLEEAARGAGVSAADLAERLDRYRAAGRAALEARPSGWHQVNVRFADYPTAAFTFRDGLLPALQAGPIGRWWFVRKHPHWRLRVHPVSGATTEDAAAHVADALDCAVSRGVVTCWRPSTYEPEAVAFGGPTGITLAHDLFHADSAGVIDYLHHTADGHHELPDPKTTSLLAMTLLMRAARLELGEQGDVWGQVEHHRPLPVDIPLTRVTPMVAPLRRLFLTDADPLLAGGPLTPVRPWIDNLTRSGQALADAAAQNHLALGPRRILARHVLFHWNRMGFTTRQQSIWSRAAREAILGG